MVALSFGMHTQRHQCVVQPDHRCLLEFMFIIIWYLRTMTIVQVQHGKPPMKLGHLQHIYQMQDIVLVCFCNIYISDTIIIKCFVICYIYVERDYVLWYNNVCMLQSKIICIYTSMYIVQFQNIVHQLHYIYRVVEQFESNKTFSESLW